MSAPAQSSAEAASSASSGPTGVGQAASAAPAAPVSATVDATLPSVGACWRGKYEITAQLADVAGGPVWRGRSVEGGQNVILRAGKPADLETRTQVWAKLGGIDSPHLQRARDAQRAGEWRVEIADEPEGVPLHEWRAKQTSVDPARVKAIVSQVAEALAALHAFELVHFSLSPEAIFVAERAEGLHCTITRLETLTTFDRPEAIAIAVDPLYAPPEAAGLNVHLPGPGLCGWDWWSLGRVTQELILGRHIIEHLGRGAARPATPETRAAAEAMLFETEPKGPRAGAVEAMPALDAQLTLLLRGLLTSVRESRWTADNVDRWVRGLPVKEHYDAPRAETHFRWRGRPCTVPEMAALLQSAEHWTENSVQLFEATTPGTLAHFLRWSPNQNAAHEQLTSALELGDMLPLKTSSPAARRETITMVALLQLSAARLIWRGRSLDSATISAMLDELGEADGLMVLRALSTRSTAMQIERIDNASGRLLTELGRTVGDAESLLRRHGWLAANDTEGAARVFRLALEPVPALRAAREELAKKFAGSDHAAMERFFKSAQPGRVELVIIAWTAAVPERAKFFTHAEAARRRAETLRARGVELTQALSWAEFERALGVGAAVLGGWGWFVLTWFLAGVAVLVLWPGPRGAAFAFVPVLVALGVRALVAPRQSGALQPFAPGARWTWRDGPPRCRRELKVAGHGMARETLETELSDVKKELATLTHVQPPPAPLPPLPRFGALRAAGWASWSLVVLCVGLGGWRIYEHRPSVKEFKAAWSPPDKPKSPKPAPVAATTEKDKEEVKISWPFKPEESAVKVPVRVTQPATSAQTAWATKHGRELVASYKADTINTLIIMPVPMDNQAAVMIFDGKHGALVNDQLYIVEFRPIPRTWVEVAGRQGVALDQ